MGVGGLTALVVNAGSTSLKAAVFVEDGSVEPLWAVNVGRPTGYQQTLRGAPGLAEVTVVGHRVVHGGPRFDRPVVIDAAVEKEIAALEEMAPLHNRATLDGLAAARSVVGPGVPHVAVFDTAFHRTLPNAAAAYGGPHQWLDQGLRRYGFHGISHEYAAHTAARILCRSLDSLRLVTCHLGGGCSLTAVDRGRSVDTTMGFTPLDGLVMGTRAGSVDAGLIFHLLRTGMSVDRLEQVFEAGSGLLGLSGVSDDLRQVITARDAGDEHAGLAIDVFIHRIATGAGAMIAALGGVDALVFTGGVAEHSAEVRTRVCEHFTFLGVQLDEGRNRAMPVDADVATHAAGVKVVVVRAREEMAIARHAFQLLAQGYQT